MQTLTRRGPGPSPGSASAPRPLASPPSERGGGQITLHRRSGSGGAGRGGLSPETVVAHCVCLVVQQAPARRRWGRRALARKVRASELAVAALVVVVVSAGASAAPRPPTQTPVATRASAALPPLPLNAVPLAHVAPPPRPRERPSTASLRLGPKRETWSESKCGTPMLYYESENEGTRMG